MKILERHKAALLAQVEGAKAIPRAIARRLKYMKLTVGFIRHLPAVLTEHDNLIRGIRRDLDKQAEFAVDTAQRLKHHEHGPLLKSARLIAERKNRAAKIAMKVAQAKTVEERQAAEREAAQLAADTEAELMPEADLVVDGRTGQAVDPKALSFPPRRIIVPGETPLAGEEGG